MNVGRVEIPSELETIVQKAIDAGIRIIDMSTGPDGTAPFQWNFDMRVHEFREDIASMMPRDTGRYEALPQLYGRQIAKKFAAQHVPQEDDLVDEESDEFSDELGDMMDDLDLFFVCPSGKEEEYNANDVDSFVLIFFPDAVQNTTPDRELKESFTT